jgi:hypothetical protein
MGWRDGSSRSRYEYRTRVLAEQRGKEVDGRVEPSCRRDLSGCRSIRRIVQRADDDAADTIVHAKFSMVGRWRHGFLETDASQQSNGHNDADSLALVRGKLQ